jgi:PEP-CTERM motif
MRTLLGALCVLTTALPAIAGPISVTQVFHDLSASQFSINGGGAQTVNGDWIFNIQTDTTAVDLDGSPNTGRFAATGSLTQAALGLNNVQITTPLFWWEQQNRGGFTSTFGLSPWGITEGPSSSFGNPNTVDLIPTLSMVTGSSGIQWFSTALALQDGTTIKAIDTLTTSGQVSSLNVAAVPEPSSFAILGLGVLGFGFHRFRRRNVA